MVLERIIRAIVSSKDRIFWLVAAAACISASAVVADSIYLTVHFFQPLFVDDAWETVKSYKAFTEGTYKLSDLFSQHNEHRIMVPRLVFLADFVVGRGLNIVNIAAIYLFQALHAALLIAMASRVSRGAVLAIVSGAIVVLLFSFGQSDNLTFGFQVSFVGVFAAATAACLATAVAVAPEASPRRSFVAMGCAALAATIATYMLSNGLLSVVVMVALAVVMRAGRTLVVFTVVFAGAIMFAYLHGAHFGHGAASPTMPLAQRLLAVVSYFLVYVGGIAGALGLVGAGSFGAIGVALGTAAAIRLIRARDTDAVHAALVGIMAFVLGTAAVTAWGRVGLGLTQALESRYMTPSSVFWAAQVVYWGSFVRLGERRVSNALFVVLAGATIILAAGRHLAQRPSAHWNDMAANLGTDALLSGVFAPQIITTIHPDAPRVERLARFLSRERLNVFAWPEARWRGKRLSDAFPVRDDRRCEVVLDKMNRLDDAGDVAVEGWAWDKSRRRPVERIVLVDPNQTIVGLGSGGWWRPDFRTLPGVESAEPGWKGFAGSGEPASVRPFAVLDHGKVACGGG